MSSHECRKGTYHQFLQVVLQRRPSEEETPLCLVLEKSLISLRLEVLEYMSFVEHARLHVALAKYLAVMEFYTHVPLHLPEELAIPFITLCQVVCSHQNFPTFVVALLSLHVKELLSELPSIIFVCVVGSNMDGRSKSLKFPQPIL